MTSSQIDSLPSVMDPPSPPKPDYTQDVTGDLIKPNPDLITWQPPGGLVRPAVRRGSYGKRRAR